MLILTLGGHSGFRVTGTGQVHGSDKVQTLAQCQLDPVPTDLQIALAPPPMGINPAALALFDHLGALRHEIERRQSQPQAETRQCLGRTNQGRFQLKTIRFIVSKVLLDIKPQSASIDHGVGHSLLALCDAKAPRGQK